MVGVAFENVRVTATDTSKVANTSATAASTGADLNGKAAQDAARQLRERLAECAARLHGGDAGDVRFANNAVQVNGQNVPFAELVRAAYLQRVQLWSDGFYATPGLHWDGKRMKGHLLLLCLWRGRQRGGHRYADGRMEAAARRCAA